MDPREGFQRLAGIFIPLFSIRTRDDSGIGEFLDLPLLSSWAASRGHRLIQILPIHEIAPGETSPYAPISMFALDPIYLSFRRLARRPPSKNSSGRATVQYREVRAEKESLFSAVYASFQGDPRFKRFEEEHAAWLSDYALFRALKEEMGWVSWEDWEPPFRDREPQALRKFEEAHFSKIRYYKFLQWRAWEEWQEARAAVRRHGVQLIGDLPFAPCRDSAEVWSLRGEFDLSRSIGVPPDDFNPKGQRWGLPAYNWKAMRGNGYAWWRLRAAHAARLYDFYRIDHVFGIYRTFLFQGDEEGTFDPPEQAEQEKQGEEIILAMLSAGTPARPIAEDLGVVPSWVRESLQRLSVPGYKILRWEKREGRYIDPKEYPPLSLATTGTHDTENLATWWDELPPAERRLILPKRAESPFNAEVHREILSLVYGAASDLAVIPIQDLLGARERINLPGSVGPDNWVWRLPCPIEEIEEEPRRARQMELIAELVRRSGRGG